MAMKSLQYPPLPPVAPSREVGIGALVWPANRHAIGLRDDSILFLTVAIAQS